MTVIWRVPKEGDSDNIVTEARLAELDPGNLPFDIDIIRGVTDAVGIMVEQGGTITSQAAEVDVYINNAPTGIFKPIVVKIDFTNQQAGETIRVREYYRIAPGGNFILEDEVSYPGVLAPALIPVNLSYSRYGVRVTMERTAGVQRDYPYEVFYEV